MISLPKKSCLWFACISSILMSQSLNAMQLKQELMVRKTSDFEVTAESSKEVWSKAQWVSMPQAINGDTSYESRFKLLYSTNGVYILFDATDKRLTVTNLADFDKLWTEDVFEFFLWPDQTQSLYFEYEISPLSSELALLVPNFNGKYLGWRPWNYEGVRKTRKATAVSGGKKQSGASVSGWTAEIFIPFELLAPLQNVPALSGAKWKANFYRVDYDGSKENRWSWMPVGSSFHEIQKFGTLVFE